MAHHWRIQLLGGLAAEDGMRRVAHFQTRPTAALLALLALRPGRPLAREVLQETLWPGAAPAAARHRLSQALSALRGVLEAGTERGAHLVSEGDSVRLAGVTCDADLFARAAAAAADPAALARVDEALALYTGDLLPACYDDWCLSERERLRSLHLGLGLRRLALLEGQGRLDAALDAAHLVLTADPANEAAHAGVLRLLTALGRGHAAIRHAQIHAAVWEERFGTPFPTALQRMAADLPGAGHITARRGGPPSSVPSEPGTLLGREAEIHQIGALLKPGAVVTLVGSGGVGKTRLALAVAHAERAEGTAVWWVPLVDVRQGPLVGQRVLSALGHEGPADQPAAMIRLVLAGARGLLVLDNLEQIAEDASRLVSELTGTLSDLAILTTSRCALGLPRERVIPVAPLPVPASGADPAELARAPSLRLLIERAQHVAPGFRLEAGNAEALRDVAARVDGVPLALELAAGRLGVLSPAQLAAQLAGESTSAADSVSLEAVLDWSLALLPADLRLFFRRLSVFRGGWTVDAAARVCEEPHAAHQLGQLRMHSLVMAAPGHDPPRFRLLEPLRRPAAAGLSEAETLAVRRRHVEWLTAVFGPIGESPAPEALCMGLEEEHDNLRTALDWSLGGAPQCGGAGAELAALAWRFWCPRGHFREGRTWLERALPFADPGTPLHAALQQGLGATLWHLGEYRGADLHLQEAYATHQEFGGRRALGDTLHLRACVAGDSGDIAAAIHLGEAAATVRCEGPPALRAKTLSNLGNVLRAAGRLDEAAQRYAEARALAMNAEDPLLTAVIRMQDAALLGARGDGAAAGAALLACLTEFGRLGERRAFAHTLLTLGRHHAARDDAERARHFLWEGLLVWREIWHQQGIANTLQELGRLERRQGRLAVAWSHLVESYRLGILLGDRQALGVTLWELGLTSLDAGDRERAVVLLAAGRARAPAPPDLTSAAQRLLAARCWQATSKRGAGLAPEDIESDLLRATAF